MTGFENSAVYMKTAVDHNTAPTELSAKVIHREVSSIVANTFRSTEDFA